MESYLIGIDGGSTSIKTVLFDQCGKEIASASNPTMRLESHTPGFETFDVDRLWASTSASIKSMLAKAAVDPSRIAGIGMCSFGNGLIILDRDGKSIAPGVFPKITEPTASSKATSAKAPLTGSTILLREPSTRGNLDRSCDGLKTRSQKSMKK